LGFLLFGNQIDSPFPETALSRQLLIRIRLRTASGNLCGSLLPSRQAGLAPLNRSLALADPFTDRNPQDLLPFTYLLSLTLLLQATPAVQNLFAAA
jgi:hypothetical protein